MSKSDFEYSEPKQSKLFLFFSGSPRLEQEFCKYNAEHTLFRFRISIFFIVLFFGIISTLEFNLFNNIEHKHVLYPFIGVFILFVSGYFLSCLKFFKKHNQSISMLLSLSLGILFIYLVLNSDSENIFINSILLVFIFIFNYTLFQLRFIWAFVSGLFLIFVYEIMSYAFSSQSNDILIIENILIYGINILGMLISYQQESNSRKLFLLQKESERKSEDFNNSVEELKNIIQERTKELELLNKEIIDELRYYQTVKNELEITKVNLHSVIESSTSAVFAFKEKGKIIYYNSRFEEFMTTIFEKEFNPDINVIRQVPKEVLQNWMKYIEMAFSGNIAITEFSKKDIFGNQRYFEISFNPIKNDENIIGVTAFARDLTEYKKSELELKKVKDELEKRVQERTEDLQKAKEYAEVANQTKSIFLANMSHEIRTPLNSVLGYAELLQPSITDSKQHEYLNAIYQNGKNLLILINDILDLSKIEAGKIEIEYSPVNISQLINEVYTIFKFNIIKKDLDFIVEINKDVPEILYLDELRMRQILLNIVGNAIKFTTTGYVKIKVEKIFSSADEEIELLISIIDTGIGIKPDQVDKIFEAFIQQEGQSTRKFGGTGLGLAITKKLVTLMNGVITVESKINEGSTFRIILSDIKVVKNQTQNIDQVNDFVPIELDSSYHDKDLFLPKNDNEEMKLMIQNEILPVWDNALVTNLNTDIIEFADKIIKFGVKFDLDNFVNFGKLMKQHTELFDIDKIEEDLNQFRKFLETL